MKHEDFVDFMIADLNSDRALRMSKWAKDKGLNRWALWLKHKGERLRLKADQILEKP